MSSPRTFAGSYLLNDGILEFFEEDDTRLFNIRNGQRRMLVAEGAGVFSDNGKRFTFVSDANGVVLGVRITDAAYDVATAENSVVYLARNDSPRDARGANQPTWAALTGTYVGTFTDLPARAVLSLRNGYLYLNGTMKLRPVEQGRFVTADNEEVYVEGRELLYGGRRYAR